MAGDTAFMETLTALCKRRGFIFQSSEIYGGIGGFWDYGPLGVELKRNVKDLWWRDMVTNPPPGPDGKELQMVGLDCSIIMNPKVWEASGHVGGFSDPMVDCKNCRRRFRADQVWQTVAFELKQSLCWDQEAVSPKKAIELVRIAEADKLDDGYPVSVRHEGEWTMGSRRCNSYVVERHPEKEATYRVHFFSYWPEAVERASYVADDWHVAREEFERSRAVKRLKRKGRVLTIAYNSSAKSAYIDSSPYDMDENAAAAFRTSQCPECQGELTKPRLFNLMFESHAGVVKDEASKVYLRPETAQGIFVNYQNVLDTTRVKVPFGIAQIGKSFRNEINPRNYIFRSREFEQMEIEFFCRGTEARRHEGTKGEVGDMDWYEFWRNVRYEWYVRYGLKSDKLRLRDQGGDELAHYSKACADIEYLFPFSGEFQELEGVAHRGNYDLTQHQKHSGKDLTYFDDDAWQRDQEKHPKEQHKEIKNKEPYRFLPTVIEPSAGVDRSALAFLCEAYTEDEAPDDKGKMQKRIVMKFHPKLAPIKVAVFPLVRKEGMPEIAEAIYKDAKQHMTAFFDVKGAIGRRYRRQDEVGTPFCVTVDGQTLEDGTVTIRDRDTLVQERVAKDQVVAWLRGKMQELRIGG